MLSLSLAWHIVWFARVTLSVALVVILVRRHIYKEFPLFAVHSVWIAFAGTALVAMNYEPLVSANQYFAGVAVSNGVEAALAFAIIYQMFAHRVDRYPSVSALGKIAFRVITLIFLVTAVALAWLVPAQGPSPLITGYTVIQRTARMLQCGQLVFLFLFCGYFRLAWRSRAFGIALGLGILSSTSLAINAIHSQTAISSQIGSGVWNLSEQIVVLVNNSTYLLAVLVWLFYCLTPERSSPPADGPLPPDDLDTWNQELERLLEP
jgi:hypothetical protein